SSFRARPRSAVSAEAIFASRDRGSGLARRVEELEHRRAARKRRPIIGAYHRKAFPCAFSLRRRVRLVEASLRNGKPERRVTRHKNAIPQDKSVLDENLVAAANTLSHVARGFFV